VAVEQITMPVTLPCHGRGGGGPGHRGGRDGGRGHGGQGGPLPCRERNPMLASNSRNSTLTTSISPLPCTPALSAARQHQLTSNLDGDGRRDGDAMATAIEGATEMQRRQWRRRWMAQQSNGGGSNGWHYDCNGRLATAAIERDRATATQQRRRWKA
jgi:hypothetical protein